MPTTKVRIKHDNEKSPSPSLLNEGEEPKHKIEIIWGPRGGVEVTIGETAGFTQSMIERGLNLVTRTVHKARVQKKHRGLEGDFTHVW